MTAETVAWFVLAVAGIGAAVTALRVAHDCAGRRGGDSGERAARQISGWR